MDNNIKNKDTGLIYAIIGIVTLVITIIGSTFAYFNASATASTALSGQTNNALSSSLSVTVTRINKTVTNANSINLVPSNIPAPPSTITQTSYKTILNNAVKAKCEADGFTGCHLYEITATASTPVSSASILLSTLTTTATTKTNWHYAIYSGTSSSVTTVLKGGNLNLSSAVDMHNGAALSGTVKYYLVIYITNTSSSQASEVGTYTGTVTMNAGGGQVSALFTE